MRSEKKAQSFSDIYELDPGEDQAKWTHINTINAPPARARHVAFALDDYILMIFGGVDKRSRFNDIWIYNCPTKTWSEASADGWQYTDESGAKSVIALCAACTLHRQQVLQPHLHIWWLWGRRHCARRLVGAPH